MRETEWETIDSAPRDGTQILIAFGNDWVSSAIYANIDNDEFPWKFLDMESENKPILNGARDNQYGPTHWAPIPKFQTGDGL